MGWGTSGVPICLQACKAVVKADHSSTRGPVEGLTDLHASAWRGPDAEAPSVLAAALRAWNQCQRSSPGEGQGACGSRARIPRGSASAQLTRGRTGGLWVPCPRPQGVSVSTAHQGEDRWPVGPVSVCPGGQRPCSSCGLWVPVPTSAGHRTWFHFVFTAAHCQDDLSTSQSIMGSFLFVSSEKLQNVDAIRDHRALCRSCGCLQLGREPSS